MNFQVNELHRQALHDLHGSSWKVNHKLLANSGRARTAADSCQGPFRDQLASNSHWCCIPDTEVSGCSNQSWPKQLHYCCQVSTKSASLGTPGFSEPGTTSMQSMCPCSSTKLRINAILTSHPKIRQQPRSGFFHLRNYWGQRCNIPERISNIIMKLQHSDRSSADSAEVLRTLDMSTLHHEPMFILQYLAHSYLKWWGKWWKHVSPSARTKSPGSLIELLPRAQGLHPGQDQPAQKQEPSEPWIPE